MAINLPQAYSKILDKGYTLKSLTAPAFKGKYEVVGGTTKSFKVYSTDAASLYDYSTSKNASGQGVGSFGYKYSAAGNKEQVITASQDKAFSQQIDKADAKFSRDGSLDTKEVMRATLEESIYPTMDKYNIDALAKAAETTAVKTLTITKANAYETFMTMTTAQTNAKVPHKGRVAFVAASAYSLLKQDDNFTPASEMTAKSRRDGNYGEIDGCMIIEVPDDYMPTKTTIVLTHEDAAAAPKYLSEYKQGEFGPEASGYYVAGRVVYEAFVFNKKKGAIQVLKTA